MNLPWVSRTAYQKLHDVMYEQFQDTFDKWKETRAQLEHSKQALQEMSSLYRDLQDKYDRLVNRLMDRQIPEIPQFDAVESPITATVIAAIGDRATPGTPTYDQIYREAGHAAGVEPELVHIPSDFIIAFCPHEEGNLLGDKAYSAVFDNSKIKRFVPEFVATTTFAQGVRRALAWFEADAARRIVDDEANTTWDRIIAAYESGLAQARD